MYLQRIREPKDIRPLTYEELEVLAREIREKLIQTVSNNGGHLASNLGIVELTIAIHRVFSIPEDKLIFDVGHQSYVHKLLTGRYDVFDTLRQHDGISGFPKRKESRFDVFETGHASTAISAALGFARARDAQKGKNAVLALVGDGALTGGMCYEALNDAGNSKTKMLVILNDNEMSISRNVGALSRQLTRLRVSRHYQLTKKRVKHMKSVPIVGKPVYRIMHGLKTMLKLAFVKDPGVGFFEALGFEYFGPINGHDIHGMEEILREAAEHDGPAVIHVITKKGNGYEMAENKPEAFHGTPPFSIETGDRIHLPGEKSCGHIMADKLTEITRRDDRVYAITAAMPIGTGLDHYAQKYPDHVIDVGIAQEHAITMAAGMAAGGMRPYVAVYASFFQRCHDQMIHDVCMQDLPVVFLLDRAGIGSNDGQTHHGVYDLAQFLPVPGINVLAPADVNELVQMLDWTIHQDHPCVLRYPRYATPLQNILFQESFLPGKWQVLAGGNDCTLLCVGSMVKEGLQVRDKLVCYGIDATVVNCSSIRPLDIQLIRKIKNPVFTLEEHMISGGFGSYVTQYCIRQKLKTPVEIFGINDIYLQHGSHSCLMKDAELDSESITNRIIQILKGELKQHG